jgi:GT2 family glycosyltransferase
MLEFVIINYKTGELTCDCIKSIYDNYGISEIVVVDNASNDDSVDIIKTNFPEIKIILNPENYGYAKAVNIGVRATKGELVVVSNSDVEFLQNSIQITEKMMIDDDSIGICGFNQQFPDGNPQRSYGYYPGYRLGILDMTLASSILDQFSILSKRFNFQKKNIYPGYADGAALMIRRSLFDKLNGFDEEFFFYTEEADYCKRVWDAGSKVAVNSNARIIHIRGAGREKGDFNENAEKLLISTKLLFIQKHGTNNEVKFFRFAQRSYFLTISVIEYLLSVIFFNQNLREKSREHLRISKLWKKAEID